MTSFEKVKRKKSHFAERCGKLLQDGAKPARETLNQPSCNTLAALLQLACAILGQAHSGRQS